ncbi:MAG: O-antigen ligase family protein [Anaerolineae bacterium]|nr:O-antigen ligase family protein [Anaerolineae bacterium]
MPDTIIDTPIKWLSALTILSAFITPNLEDSLPKILGLYLGIAIYYALVRINLDSIKLDLHKLIFTGILVVGAGIVFLGIAGGRFPEKIPVISDFAKLIQISFLASPSLEYVLHPNALSGVILLIYPTSWYVYYTFKDADKKLAFFALAVFLIHSFYLVIAQSRGAWLAIFLTGMLWLVYRGVSKQDWLIIWGPLWVHAGLLLSVIYVLPKQARLLIYLTKLDLYHTFGQRIIIWDWALKIWQDFPLTGIGYNTFRNAAGVLYPRGALTDIDFSHAHNIFLDAGVSLGIGAVFAVGMIWWLTARYLLDQSKQEDVQNRLAAKGLLLGWMAFFFFNLMDTIPLGSKLGILFWVFIGIIQVILKPNKSNSVERAAR